MKKTLWIAALSFLLGIFLAGFIFVYLPEKDMPESYTESQTSAPLSSVLYASEPLRDQTKLDFVTITEKVSPAVVKVEAERSEKRRVLGFDDSPFEDFWDRFFGAPEEKEYRYTTQGSGFFISENGYILTNYHIVEKALNVTVTSRQGDEFKAEIVGTDPNTDIALLKVEVKKAPFITLGDSDRLKVGEWVIAIGNPLGMSHTVTAGIVSAKGRQLGTYGSVTYQDFIQTDAAINRGNSGGPLVNMQAEVVGITSNILSPTGGNIGIGFAIPSDLAQKIVTQLKDSGHVVRGYLGIRPAPVSEDIKKSLNLKSKKGALITSVEKGTPADKAGLERYDVIIAINGEPVKDIYDLRFKIADIKPGTKVDITVIRDNEEKTFTVKIAEQKEQVQETPEADDEHNLGFSVTELTPRLANRYGLETTEGLLITDVKQYGPAWKKGLRRGHIILEANRKKVTKGRELRNIIKKLEPGDAILLLVRIEIQGQPNDQIITIRIPE